MSTNKIVAPKKVAKDPRDGATDILEEYFKEDGVPKVRKIYMDFSGSEKGKKLFEEVISE